jgi:lipoprotein-anchoring transpeptidase ErfK/SrfK
VKRLLPLLSALGLACLAPAAKLATFDGITFPDARGKLFLPIREASKALNWPLSKGPKAWKFHGHTVPAASLRSLPDGSRLVDVAWLAKAGAIVNRRRDALTTIKDRRRRGKAFYVRRGTKRVFVNKRAQMLVAFQGRRTVLRSPISIGREGHETPTGIFRAQGLKEKVHISKLYDNTPLPWSVHIVGNIFIHGAESTPSRGSHGCIRLPITGANPARWFFYWVDPGTPVTILGKWPKGARG